MKKKIAMLGSKALCICLSAGLLPFAAFASQGKQQIQPQSLMPMVEAISIDGYSGHIAMEYSPFRRTITFTVPANRLDNGTLSGTITELVTNYPHLSLGLVFVVDGVRYPREQGEHVAFQTGDSLYMGRTPWDENGYPPEMYPNEEYTLVIEQAAPENQIRGFSISCDGVTMHEAAVEQSTHTVTFRVPGNDLQNGDTLSGNLCAVDADGNALTFRIGGTDYLRTGGEHAAFRSGDQVYSAADRIYTIEIEAAAPELQAVVIDTSVGMAIGRADAAGRLVFEHSQDRIEGNLRFGNADGTPIIFEVDNVQYPRYQGQQVTLRAGDKAYLEGGIEHTIDFV